MDIMTKNQKDENVPLERTDVRLPKKKKNYLSKKEIRLSVLLQVGDKYTSG